MSQLRIAVDIMGGDHAPQAISHALIAHAIKNPEVTYYAVGMPEVLSQYFATRPGNILLCPAEFAVEVDMTVAEAAKLGASSSIGKSIGLLKAKEAECVVSAGNTAALMSIAYLTLKTRSDVRRPTILAAVEYKGNRTMVTDLGANIVCKPEDFLSNARVAVKEHSKSNPSVALLNVGIEASKGTPALKEAAKLLEESDINYQGFVEGYDVINAKHDIIVCDGFVGNCITKLMESMIELLKASGIDEAELPRVQSAALLAGLNGHVYKVHGSAKKEDFELAFNDIIAQFSTISV